MSPTLLRILREDRTRLQAELADTPTESTRHASLQTSIDELTERINEARRQLDTRPVSERYQRGFAVAE